MTGTTPVKHLAGAYDPKTGRQSCVLCGLLLIDYGGQPHILVEGELVPMNPSAEKGFPEGPVYQRDGITWTAEAVDAADMAKALDCRFLRTGGRAH